MKFKYIVLLITISFIFSTFFLVYSPVAPSSHEIISGVNQKVSVFSDSPIIITSNTQLASYANSGSGTSQDPYVIKNHYFQLTNSNQKAIEINNTNSYFVIQNITIFARNGYSISLNNIQNGIIEHSLINGSLYGLYITHSQNLLVDNNNFRFNTVGLTINNSNKIHVLNNTFFQNYTGLTAGYSLNTTMQSNSFNYNENAAFLTFSNSSSWQQNQIINIHPTQFTPINQLNRLRNGIQIHSSSHSEFTNNVCTNCSDLFIFYNSNANTITNNTGFNTDSFIAFSQSNNSLITNNSAFSTFDQGLVFYISNNNTISGNTIINSFNPTFGSTSGGTAYIFQSCSDSSVYGNNATNSFTGFSTFDSNTNNYTSNVVSNTYQNGFTVINSTNDTITKNNVNSSWIGFSFTNTSSAKIIGNSANNSVENGFSFQNANNNIVFNNKAFYNQVDGFNFTNSNFNKIWLAIAGNNTENGISLHNCDNNSIQFSVLIGNQNGLFLTETNNSLFFDSNIYDNSAYGLFSNNSNFNKIELIRFSNNLNYGVFLTNSHYNEIFLCSFTSNGNHTSQAYSDSSTNSWSNLTYGNYWSDYKGSDSNHDKIGDTPYIIDGPSQQVDPHPLMVKPTLNLDNLKPTKFSILDLLFGDLLIILGITVLLTCLGTGTYLFISFRKELASTNNKDYHLSFLSFIRQKLSFKREPKTESVQLGDETLKKLELIIEENKKEN